MAFEERVEHTVRLVVPSRFTVQIACDAGDLDESHGVEHGIGVVQGSDDVRIAGDEASLARDLFAWVRYTEQSA